MLNTNTAFIEPDERARLVHLCAMISGDRDAAEDLAQETLLEAWRSEHQLRDRSRRAQWLTGIAHNICRRWLRRRGRDVAHLTGLAQNLDDEQPGTTEDTLPGDVDIELELERKELILLLDKALALLPPETRTIFIKRYVEESPLGEIAAQLGTNASAVAMRIQRGKLTLQRILTTEMRHEIAPYVVQAGGEAWEETSLWCHNCGQRRLLGRRDPEEGKLLLKCPLCSPAADEVMSRNHLSILRGIKGYKPLYTRLITWGEDYYHACLRTGMARCTQCHQPAKVSIGAVRDLPDWYWQSEGLPRCNMAKEERVLSVLCSGCTMGAITSLQGFVQFSSAGHRFLQEHERIRALPQQELEVDGRYARVVRFESVTSGAQLTTIVDYETFEVLRTYGEG